MRVILLRILLAWWLIPMMWVIEFPLIALLFGWEVGIECTTEISTMIWKGELTDEP